MLPVVVLEMVIGDIQKESNYSVYLTVSSKVSAAHIIFGLKSLGKGVGNFSRLKSTEITFSDFGYI